MSKRRDVMLAVKALVAAALPLAEVRGFDKDTAKPGKLGPAGTVIGHPGDPGEPEVDLCPPAYHYEHSFRLEVAPSPDAADPDAMLDDMFISLGAAVAADRTLRGLCSHLEASAPDLDDADVAGAKAQRWGAFDIVAHYTTLDPLN